jgi:hypothetical protein
MAAWVYRHAPIGPLRKAAELGWQMTMDANPELSKT